MVIPYIRFSLQLMAAESIFLIYAPRRKFFILRLLLALAAYFAIVYVLSIVRFPFRFGGMVKFFCMFLMTVGMMPLCFKINFKDAVFNGSGGYALQHAVYCLMTVIAYYTGHPDTSTLGGKVLDYLYFRTVSYLAVDAAVFFFLIRPLQKAGDLNDKDPKILICSALIISSALVLNELSGMRINGAYSSFTTSVVCKLYSLLCCIVVLSMQLVMVRGSRIKRDNELLEYMLKMQADQYTVSKETIELINIKCHDLKHQIAALNSMSEEERLNSINEIKKLADIYDSCAKTGNASLDLVIMEKSLICKQHNIKFTYLADVSKLDIMAALDIYTLFENAIDNAIRSVLKEKDKEKRIISLKVRREKNMLFIHFENYFSGTIEFDNGVPVTGQDKKYHGFGTKSMRQITQKYGGEIEMNVSEEHFNVDIMIPIE